MYQKQGMSLKEAQKQWNRTTTPKDRGKIEDLAAWLRFHSAVKQLRVIAAEVGIKSPDIVRAVGVRAELSKQSHTNLRKKKCLSKLFAQQTR
jgi:hypothetical protein